jgi:hypothetical protein
MKKTFSIVFVPIFILSGIHFSYAIHYCGGKIAATRFSLTGKKASCGMEAGRMSCPLKGNFFTSACCFDKISFYSTDDTCIKPLQNDDTATRPFSPASLIHSISPLAYPCYLVMINTNNRSPGNDSFSSVILPDICNFRI